MTSSSAMKGHDDLIGAYRRVRDHSEHLAAPLSDEDCALQSMTDASPAKWHLAHTTWFFETVVLQAHSAGYQPFHPRFGYLFNSYYESLGPRHERPRRGLLSRPGRAEVMAYRHFVDEALTAMLAGGADAAVRDLVTIGLQHEQQHQELLLMDIKHALSCNPLQPAYRAPLATPQERAAVPRQWRDVPAGRQDIGADPAAGFAYDNEMPRHVEWIEACQMASRPVTCAEYVEFIEAGGYAQATLWLSDGWAQVNQQGWSAPLYWYREDGAWWRFTLFGPQPVDMAAPVSHISFYEADAFARWAGARLPRESEWEAYASARAGFAAGAGGGLEPRALSAEHPGAAADFLGSDVWEWTQSAYAPYPGFTPARGALAEYNGKFMCNQMVLRGGCAATPAGHTRPTYRNFYYPHQRWMFAGVRLAKDA